MDFIYTPYYYGKEDGKGNYTPYDVFSLQTNLLPKIQDIFGNDSFVALVSVLKDDKIYLRLSIKKDFKEIEPDKIQKDKIVESLNRFTGMDKLFVIVWSTRTPALTEDSIYISPDWIKTIYDAIIIPNDIPKLLFEDGIYVDISGYYPSHEKVYRQVFQTILKQIRELYSNGTHANVGFLMDNWNLEKFNDYYYRCKWEDNRFSPDRHQFIHSRIGGEDIIVRVKLNEVERHSISEVLNTIELEYKYLTFGIQFSCDTYDKTKRVTNIIFRNKYECEGTVDVFECSTRKILEKYLKALSNITDQCNITSYKTSSNYICSVKCKSQEAFGLIKRVERSLKS